MGAKRTLVFALLVFGMLACLSRLPAPTFPGVVIVLEAQTLPIVKTFVWDADPAADGVLNYVVTLDGTTIGSPTSTSQTVTFTTAATHTLTVAGQNIFGLGPASTLTVIVKLPTAPANLKLQ